MQTNGRLWSNTHAAGYEIVREYIDEGISGWKSKERLSVQELIEDAKGGAFKFALCWDIDRFSRFDPLEANRYWYLLDEAGGTPLFRKASSTGIISAGG